MNRSAVLLSTLVFCAAAKAQEIPGVRASLSARSLVPAYGNVEMRLFVQVDADTEVPAELLTGWKLTVKCEEQVLPPVTRAGKPGMVPLAAGTKIERTFAVPAASFLPSPDHAQIAHVTVGLAGIAGSECTFRIAPDTRKVDVGALDLAKTQVVLCTNYGEMRVSFRPDKAPKTVENFVKLALQGFYDGTKFHRVKQDFMIQGGDPNTKDESKREQWGLGGPGYSIPDEFNDLRHLRGTLSMANRGTPNSGGSQFFVVQADQPQLDKRFAAFGNLEEGADTLDRIAGVTCTGPNKESPVSPVVLYAVIVLPVKR
jgi:peptidyl-prolyl cis-trans isomerase B (cyclophilin B)